MSDHQDPESLQRFLDRQLKDLDPPYPNTFRRFMRLPIELRQMIWKYALPPPRDIDLSGGEWRAELPEIDELPALLFVKEAYNLIKKNYVFLGPYQPTYRREVPSPYPMPLRRDAEDEGELTGGKMPTYIDPARDNIAVGFSSLIDREFETHIRCLDKFYPGMLARITKLKVYGAFLPFGKPMGPRGLGYTVKISPNFDVPPTVLELFTGLMEMVLIPTSGSWLLGYRRSVDHDLKGKEKLDTKERKDELAEYLDRFLRNDGRLPRILIEYSDGESEVYGSHSGSVAK